MLQVVLDLKQEMYESDKKSFKVRERDYKYYR